MRLVALVGLVVLVTLACAARAVRADEVPDEDEAPASAAAPASAPVPAVAPSPFAPPPDLAAPPADATTSASGLASKLLAPGTGTQKPAPSDVVELNYTAWTSDGKLFDSTVKRGQAARFELQRVLPGLVEGVGLMVAGEKRRLWIPEGLAWKGIPGRPAGMVVFDVELVGVTPAPPAPSR